MNELAIRHLHFVFLLTTTLLLGLVAPTSAQASLPTFSKSFNLDTIGPGSISTLTFTIDNSANAGGVLNLAFTDNLPAGMLVADPANASTTCGVGYNLSAPAGGSAISFSNGRLGAGELCIVRVNVTSSTVGIHMNVSGDLTSSAGNSGTASDDLNVVTTLPGFSKSFSPTTVAFGGRSTLTFTIDNSKNGVEPQFLLRLPGHGVARIVVESTSTCNAPSTSLLSGRYSAARGHARRRSTGDVFRS